MQHLNLGSGLLLYNRYQVLLPNPVQQHSYDTRITCHIIKTSFSGKRKDRFNCHWL